MCRQEFTTRLISFTKGISGGITLLFTAGFIRPDIIYKTRTFFGKAIFTTWKAGIFSILFKQNPSILLQLPRFHDEYGKLIVDDLAKQGILK